MSYEQSQAVLLDGADVEAFAAAWGEAGEGLQHRRGDAVDTALAGAHVRIEATYTTPWESHDPMEPAATVAPGECPGSFASECAIDGARHRARHGPDRAALRNYAEVDPSTGKPFSSKWLRECYARGAERFGWSDRDPRPSSMRSGRDLVGYGMATAVFRRCACRPRRRCT